MGREPLGGAAFAAIPSVVLSWRVWEVRYLQAAEAERDSLPANEKAAIYNAVFKLESLGPNLPYPHSSAVKGAAGLRELRPRGGRSPWRALYCRVGDTFVIAAVGPEAQHDKRGFEGVCQDAEARLAQGDDDEGIGTEDRP